MKLLIVTQKVDINDDVLGFFHGWIEEFAKKCEKVTVIALGVGEYNLPENVKILSLGKEKSESKIKYLANFYKYVWRERNNYDVVFVHMNQIYVVLGGWLWKILNKKIGLWYVHKQVGWDLKIAEKIANVIFTAAQRGFNLKTDKLKVLGHGIPVDNFKNPGNTKKDGKLTLISVGRITPIKNLDILIKAAAILKNNCLDFKLLIVGSPIEAIDYEYFEKLKKLVSDYKLGKAVIFIGSIPNNMVREYYWKSDLSINLCPTGGMDKAVLESMAAGLPVIVSNQAFEDYFGDYADLLIFKERDEIDLSKKIMNLINSNKENIINLLFKKVEAKSDSKKLIDKILLELKNIW